MKKIALTNGKLMEATRAAKRLSEERMPVGVACKVVKLCKALDTQADLFCDVRDKLAREHSMTLSIGNNGPSYAAPGANEAEKQANAEVFASAINELLAVPAEVEIDCVELPSDIKVAPAVLMALEGMVTVPNA